MAPLEAVSLGKKKTTYESSNWGNEMDDLLDSIDSPSDKKKKSAAAKSKSKSKKSSSSSGNGSRSKGGGGRRLDDSEDNLFESSDNFSGYHPKDSKSGNGKDSNFELSVASDFGPLSPDNKGHADLLGDMVTSKDLDDSILGGLVGGFKRGSAKAAPAKPVAKPSPEAARAPYGATGKPPVAAKPKEAAPAKADNFDSSDNSFDEYNVPIFDKEKRPSAAAAAANKNSSQSQSQSQQSSYGYNPTAPSRPASASASSAPGRRRSKDFDESDSFDEANLPMFGDASSRPSTAGASGGSGAGASASDAGRPKTASSASTAPAGTGWNKNSSANSYANRKVDESTDSFDDTNLPMFDKESRPSVNTNASSNGSNGSNFNQTGKKSSPKKEKAVSPGKGGGGGLDDSGGSSFDAGNLPIFGGPSASSGRPHTGGSSGGGSGSGGGGGPLGERTKVLSPAGSKKDLLAAARAEAEASETQAAAAAEGAYSGGGGAAAEEAPKSSMPFIPSFYDAKPRSRRNLGTDSAVPSRSTNKADELDKLLGVGSASNLSAISALPNKDAIKDPFSGNSKPSIFPATIERQSSALQSRFSDSSDSDAEQREAAIRKDRGQGQGQGQGVADKERPKTADVHGPTAATATAAATAATAAAAAAATGGVGVEKKKMVSHAMDEAQHESSSRPHTAPTDGGPRSAAAQGLSIDPESPPKSSLKQQNNSTRSKSPGRSPGGSTDRLLNTAGSSSFASHFASPDNKGARFASEADRLDTEGSTDRHGAYPAWLGGGSGTPGGNSTTSAGGRLSTPTDRDGHRGSSGGGETQDKLYRTMQQRLEQIQLEKEAVERQLRLEIDNLKQHSGGGLYRQNSGGDPFFYRGSSFGPGNGGDASQSDFTAHQINDLKNEISRLKDELSIQQARAADEAREEKERYGRNMEGAENKRRDDIRVIEIRHEEAVAALKRLHAEEISAIKQRARDGMALEELSSQIRTTTGSLRLIEEHMNSQYKGLDIVKEGQFEARERVLASSESQSRERAELAEAEGYRLKGILVHMEQMTASLRGQGSEERERLKYEHRRLEMAQVSLDQERKAHQARMHDELDELKKKSAAFGEQMRLKESEYFSKRRDLEDGISKLDLEKEDFRNHVAHGLKTTEEGLVRLKEGEAKLVRTREEVRREALKLKEDRAGAVNDLLRADEFYAQIEEDRRSIAAERVSLEDTARRVQAVSEELETAGADVERRSENLYERERVLELGMRDMHQSGNQLVQREYEVVTGSKAMESKQLALREAEDAALFQRVSAAKVHREASGAARAVRFGQGQGQSQGHGHGRSAGTAELASRLPPPPQKQTANDPYSAESMQIEQELKNIQRSIRSSKFSSTKSSSARAATFGFLSEEVNYITNNNGGSSSSYVSRESYY
jgi:hypothetical protein